MSNPCSNSDCGDFVVGSPNPDLCAVCPPDAELNTHDLLKKLLDEVCLLKSQLSNQDLLINRLRNRMAEVERKPSASRQPRQNITLDACGSGLEDEVDALVACNNSSPSRVALAECQALVGVGGGKVGKTHIGAKYLDAPVVLRNESSYGTSGNYTYSMSGYDRDPCHNRAIVSVRLGISATSSGSATALLRALFAAGANGVIGYSHTESSGSDRSGGVVSVPIIGGQISFSTIKSGSFTGGNMGIILLGFEP